MKKAKIIASVAASAAMAALPAAGVFATTEVTESVAATVASTCGLYVQSTSGQTTTYVDAGDATYTNSTMTPGSDWTAEDSGDGAIALGKTYYVNCNDTKGWTITAIGDGSGKTKDMMDASTKEADDIATSATTPTASDTAGSWAYELKAVSGQASAHSGVTVGSYMAVPTTAATIVDGTSTAGNQSSFTTGYRVYIGLRTPAATYTGKVKYTLVAVVSGDNDSGGTTNNNNGGNGLLEEEEEETPAPTPTNLPTLTMASNYYTTNNSTTNNYTTNNSSTSNNSSDNSTTNNSSTNNSTTETSDDETSTTSNDASDGTATALGVVKSSSDTGTTESTSSSNNTATIAAVAVAGTAALAAGGYILYNKSKEKSGE